MILDTTNTIIQLVVPEVDAFFGRAPASESMLEYQGVSYKTFLNKVEDNAEQMFIRTERTVVIYNVESGETIATYNECGLVIRRLNQPQPSDVRRRRRSVYVYSRVTT